MQESMKISVTQNDMAVLKYLLDNSYVLPTKTISIDQLASSLVVKVVGDDGEHEEKKLAKATIYKIVKKLSSEGYLKQGSKVNNSNRFYVSTQGAELYTSFKKLDIEEKAALVKAYAQVIDPDGDCDWEQLFEQVKSYYIADEQGR